MRKILLLAGAGLLTGLCTTAVFAATEATVTNTSSMEKYVEARAGMSDSCDSDQVVWSAFLKPHDLRTVPYGGSITMVCARYKIGNSWSGWYKTGCPSSDNSLCKINL